MVRSFFQLTKEIPMDIYSWLQFHFTHILNSAFLDSKHSLYCFWKRKCCSNLVNRPSLCQCTNHLGFSVKWLASTSLQITECLSCYLGEPWVVANRKLFLEAVNVICLFAPPPTGGWLGERDVWIPSVIMLTRDVTYFDNNNTIQ